MKCKLLQFVLAVLGICISGMMPAQNWCAPGTNWWYDHWGSAGNQVGVVHVECMGDTIILGETVHRAAAVATGYDYLIDMPYQVGFADLVTRSTMDQVSYWDGAQWHLLFDLSAGIGDQWVLGGPNFADRAVEVADTGSMLVDGEPLRYSVVTFNPPFQGMTTIAGDTIMERMGYTRLFIDPNRTVGLDGDVYDLRCYQDDDLSYSTLHDASCDLWTGMHERSDVGRVTLAPNPSDGRFTIRFPAQAVAGVLEVRDPVGRLVLREHLPPHAAAHPVALAGAGLYFCRVEWGTGTVTVPVVVRPR